MNGTRRWAGTTLKVTSWHGVQNAHDAGTDDNDISLRKRGNFFDHY